MAKRTKKERLPAENPENVKIAGAGLLVETPINETLRTNYMPYAMSVIVSRALPEIDGFKPSHRKLLYTMYQMGLLSGPRTKSANVVGQTMRLNPHGDMAIYETLVRLTKDNQTLLHPYVDSKGNFGKSYSRDMAFAAPRYTEVKLAPISGLLFGDIGKDTVDFVDNYDSTTKEPVLLPVTFPSILVNYNIGIAVGMASTICPFNLNEVCETTVNLIKNPTHDLMQTLKGPDFPCGGILLYDEKNTRDIFETGRGSFKIRARYQYDAKQNRIEITEIPPSTTVEAIIDKLSELVKSGKVRELSDMRDETDLKGLCLALDLKRGVDGEKLIRKLFKLTPLEDNFTCNFTILVNGSPMLLGIREILREWIDFRRTCVRRRTNFERKGKADRLHILEGLKKILLDIDKAIKIVRETEEEKEVVPNLMIGFGIDEIQAEYVAEIKLRHLNREYILSRLTEIDQLMADIAELDEILRDSKKIDRIIITELAGVAKKFAKPRVTQILYEDEISDEDTEEAVPSYPCHIFFTKDGYFKKILQQSLRMNSEQKLKDGDCVQFSVFTKSDANLLFFTNKRQVYKSQPDAFPDTKASALGDYVAGTLGMQEDEVPIALIHSESGEGNLVFFYQNGKASKLPLSCYETKANRRKLQNAYSAKSELVAVFLQKEDKEYAVFTDTGRMLLINTAFIPRKMTKDTVGINIISLKNNSCVVEVKPADNLILSSPHRFRAKNLPATGAIVRIGDIEEQGDEVQKGELLG